MKRATLLAACLLLGLAALFPEEYSLERYLRRVEEFSRDLRLAGGEIARAELGFKQAESALFPSVFAEAEYARNFLEAPQPYSTNNEYSAGAALNQTLLNLKAYHALKFGKEYTALSRTVYEETRRAVKTAAKKVYYQAVLFDEIRKVKESSERSDYAVYQDVKRKFEAGAAAELEVLRAEVVWRSKIAEASQARKNLAVALLTMKSLAGIPPDETALPAGSFAEIPPPPSEPDPAKAAAARSDYELLLRQKRLAEIAIDLAAADRYPTVSAGLSYGYTAMDDGFKLGGGTDILRLGIRISLPVYTGGALATNVEIEKISLEQKRTELEKLRDDIFLEIRRIFLSIGEARERIDSARAVLETAERAYALALLSQQNGIITQLELNESAVQLEGARLGLNIAIFDYLVSYFDWEKATGAL